MAKARRVFLCRACGGVQSRWMGKCPDCGEWDALEETVADPLTEQQASTTLQGLAPTDTSPAGALPVGDIEPVDHGRRLSSGILELDRVLGAGADGAGGLVPGSAVLVGGEPGIGKSTLLLQAAAAWAARGRRVLYVSSEESAHQIRMRFDRLWTSGAPANLLVLADTNLARIVEQARKHAPEVLVIDSVQMIFRPDIPGAPGSVTQLRRCAADLAMLAKTSGTAVVLVGHVTKDGRLAGPRLLEHLVDAVLSFEGDRLHAHRLVRAIKNRFGTTLEIGLFEMTGEGLRETPEGALAPSDGIARPGSCVAPVISGTRCMAVELQALTATGFLGAVKRRASGVDVNRLAMLIAVLEQHAGMRLADRDVFASSVGGVRVVEPAADLALLLAIAGAQLHRAVPSRCAIVGEVGLGGEIRPVPHLEQRAREAARLGYRTLMAPPMGGKGQAAYAPGVELLVVRSVQDAFDHLSVVADRHPGAEPKPARGKTAQSQPDRPLTGPR